MIIIIASHKMELSETAAADLHRLDALLLTNKY